MLVAIWVTAFLSALLLVLGVGSLLSRLFESSAPSARISGLGEGPLSRLVARVADWNRQRPSLARLCAHIDRRLILAGRPLGTGEGAELLALLELVAAGLLVGLGGLLLLAGIGLLTAITAAGSMALTGAALGYAWMESLIQDRQRAISRQYPGFLDLAVMTMEAGSSFQESVEVYIRDTPPEPLREELQTALQDLGLGVSEEEALMQLNARIVSADVRDSVYSVINGLRAGTSLGQLLRDQSEGLRFRRSQMAERIAEELKIRLLGPATMMMAAVIVLILGPVFVNITRSGMFQ